MLLGRATLKHFTGAAGLERPERGRKKRDGGRPPLRQPPPSAINPKCRHSKEGISARALPIHNYLIQFETGVDPPSIKCEQTRYRLSSEKCPAKSTSILHNFRNVSGGSCNPHNAIAATKHSPQLNGPADWAGSAPAR